MQFQVKRPPAFLWNPAMEDKPGLLKRIMWFFEAFLPHRRAEPIGYGLMRLDCRENCQWWITYPPTKKVAADVRSINGRGVWNKTQDKYIPDKEDCQGMFYHTCTHCGAHLDPGEHCECDGHEQPEIDMVKRPVRRKRTTPPREYNTESYIRQRWLEYDMR